METTLHRQLKALYAPDASGCEVSIGGYRIDAVDGDRLIEIQQASLGAIRDKIRVLLENYDVTVVKPLVARKYLIKRARKRGRVISKRYSPLRETIWHLFADLVHFVDVFPHPRLTLEVIYTEQEEHRLPKKTKRWRRKDYRVEDRLLREITNRITLQTTADLIDLLPASLPAPFSTADLAREVAIPRWLAQKVAYCLRKTNAVTLAGKEGNSLLYEVASAARKAA